MNWLTQCLEFPATKSFHTIRFMTFQSPFTMLYPSQRQRCHLNWPGYVASTQLCNSSLLNIETHKRRLVIHEVMSGVKPYFSGIQEVLKMAASSLTDQDITPACRTIRSDNNLFYWEIECILCIRQIQLWYEVIFVKYPTKTRTYMPAIVRGKHQQQLILAKEINISTINLHLLGSLNFLKSNVNVIIMLAMFSLGLQAQFFF